jgi:hypothetical protein
MKWYKLTEKLPDKRDEYYLFGDFADEGGFVYDKYHYSLDGRVNGWRIESAIMYGCLWWGAPEPPTGDRESDS